MVDSALLALGCRHPLGLSAGPDRGGDGLAEAADAGFAFIEVGTVTPRAEPDHNPGVAALIARLRRGQAPQCVIGANIGSQFATPPYGAGADWAQAILALGDVARFITINLSAPYYAALLRRDSIECVLEGLTAAALAAAPPLLVKLPFGRAQDDEAVDALLPRLASCGIAAIVVSSATAAAGCAARHIALARTAGGLPVVASGGVRSVADLENRLAAGAQLVQVYSPYAEGGVGATRALLAAAQCLAPTRR